jgi:hypothetical protein
MILVNTSNLEFRCCGYSIQSGGHRIGHGENRKWNMEIGWLVDGGWWGRKITVRSGVRKRDLSFCVLNQECREHVKQA